MAIIDIKVPSPGESISYVELFRWLVADGDVVRKNAEIAELESDKATLMLVAEESGKISLKAAVGDSLEVGFVACTIDTSVQPEEAYEPKTPEKEEVTPKKTKPEEKPKQETKKESRSAPAGFDNVKITPLAQKVMDEYDVSVEDVINGLRRLKRSDVEAAMGAGEASVASGLKKPASRESKTERMSSLRRKLSERLISVKNETAMLTTFNEVNMKPIMDLRKKYQDKFVAKHGIKLGMMSFFMKACATALQDFPNVNSMMDGENSVTFDYADISVAVSTPKGLMVPLFATWKAWAWRKSKKRLQTQQKKPARANYRFPK